MGKPWTILKTSCWLSDAILKASCWLSDAILKASCWLSDAILKASCWLSDAILKASCWLSDAILKASWWLSDAILKASCWLSNAISVKQDGSHFNWPNGFYPVRWWSQSSSAHPEASGGLTQLIRIVMGLICHSGRWSQYVVYRWLSVLDMYPIIADRQPGDQLLTYQ